MKAATAEQIVRIAGILSKASEHALGRLIEEPGMLRDLLEAAEKRHGDNYLYEITRWKCRESMNLPRYPEPEVFEVPVSIDPQITLETMLQRGDYGFVHPGLRKLIVGGDFPRGQSQSWGKIKVSVLHFDRRLGAHSERLWSVEQEMEELSRSTFNRRYRPLTVDELLALGVQKPDLQTRFPLVACGLFWEPSGEDGLRLNLTLDKNPADPEGRQRRLLGYDLSSNGCYRHYRILAVKC